MRVWIKVSNSFSIHISSNAFPFITLTHPSLITSLLMILCSWDSLLIRSIDTSKLFCMTSWRLLVPPSIISNPKKNYSSLLFLFNSMFHTSLDSPTTPFCENILEPLSFNLLLVMPPRKISFPKLTKTSLVGTSDPSILLVTLSFSNLSSKICNIISSLIFLPPNEFLKLSNISSEIFYGRGLNQS
jgi:hypothetical protein